MPTISATVPLLTVSADAKPSNYLVNHVSWAAPTENINWSEVCVLRSTSGFPMHINDGTTIFSEQTYSLAATVTAVYTGAALESITFSGGGKTTSGLTSESYIAVRQKSVLNYQGLPTSIGLGATFDVIRSSAYLGGVESVTINSPGGDYQVGDIITLYKDEVGYLNNDGSLNSFGSGVANITVLVSAVTGATSGIKTVTLNSQPGLQNFNSGTFTYNNIESFATDTSLGANATFDVVRTGNGTVATTTLSVRSSGANYKVNDVVRIPGYLIGGRVDTTELGITKAFHVYDTGAVTALTTNPGYGVTGTDLRAPKYYYSIFVKYTVNDPALASASNFIPKYSKIAEVSSYAIKDEGTLDTLLGHLPLFYRKNYQGKDNQDLRDFIRLFAFHYDVYLASTLSVFNSSSILTMDNNLVELALKQFGFNPANVASISQARTLLGLLIRSYQNSGSLEGISNFVEGLTGYGASIISTRNLLNDYDTSSFVDSTGFWYPDPTSLGYGAAAPFASGLTLAGPTASTTYGTTTTNIASYANQSGLTLTNASSSGYLVTVDSTTGLTSGAVLTVTSTAGTGVLVAGTVVTSIVNSTQFKISATATTPLSGATLVTATNISSGMAKIVTATTAAVTFNLGLKDTITATNYASGTNVIVVKPLVASVGDTVISSVTSKTTGQTTNYVPVNTKVTAVNSGTGALTLSNNISAAMATGTSVLLAPSPTTDKVGAFSSLMLVLPAVPYAFNIKANAAGTTLATVSVGINWYNKNQQLITSTSASLLPITGWNTVGVSGVSPSNAVYAQPYFSARNNYFVDAMQFESGINANAVNITNGLVSMTTDLTHNFEIGNTISVSGYGPPIDGNFTITGTNAATKLVAYDLLSRSIISVTPDTPAGITMTGASSSGAVITVSSSASNALLSVGDAVKITSGTGAFHATNPTYVTEINSTTSFTVSPAPITPLSGATVKTGYVTYGTNNNNFVPGNIVNVATITPAGYTTTTGFTIVSSVQGTSGNFVVANTTTTAATFSQTSAPIIVWGDLINLLFAKAAINQDIQGSALVASQSLFEDARTTQISVLANRRNLILNPSFEDGISTWSLSSAQIAISATTSQAVFGFKSAKIDIVSTSSTNHYISNSSRIGVNPSSATSENVYTASAYLKRTAGAGVTYVIQIAWFETAIGGSAITSTTTTWTSGSYYNSSNVLITQAEGTPVNLSSNAGWNRVFVIAKAPSNASYAEVRIIRTDTTGNASTVYVDGVLFEPLSVLKHYFDGSFDGQNYIYHGDIDSTWESTAHNSVSHLYYNRVFNTGKIDSLITEGMYYA